MRPQLFKYGFGRGALNAYHQLAFVSKIERIQSQQLAQPANRRLHGQAALNKFNTAAAAGRELMHHGIDAATGGIPQGFHAGDRPQRLDKRGEHRAVAAQFPVQPQAFAQVKDGRPVTAQRAADQQHVAHGQLLRAPVNIGGDRPHPGGVDKELIRRAALHHLGIAGDDSNPCLARGVRHAADHRRERLHRQTFFKDKSAGEVARNGTTDGDIVRGTADGQLADIAAGEE